MGVDVLKELPGDWKMEISPMEGGVLWRCSIIRHGERYSTGGVTCVAVTPEAAMRDAFKEARSLIREAPYNGY